MKTVLIASVVAVSTLLTGCGEPAKEVVIPASLTATPVVAKANQLVYPSSMASYSEVNKAIGCGSKFSDQKQKDIFNRDYKNHWFEWSGTVVLPDSNGTSLNTDYKGIQDLSVDFAKAGMGYDLLEDQEIKVRFLMTGAGGCFLAFRGDYAVIVK